MYQVNALPCLQCLPKIAPPLEAVHPPFDEGHYLILSILKAANTGVRNTGTISGNLMLKHAHPDFPSDLFVSFEAANCKMVIRSTTEDSVVSPQDFLAMDMTKVSDIIWLVSQFVHFGTESYQIVELMS